MTQLIENKGPGPRLLDTIARGRDAAELFEPSMTAHSFLSRLKALQPNPRQRRPSLATGTGDEMRGASPDVPAGAIRLAEILCASPRRNRFGKHLGLRRWF